MWAIGADAITGGVVLFILQMGKLWPQWGGDFFQIPEPVLQAARLGVRVPCTLDVFPAPLGHFASKMQDLSYQEKDFRSPVCSQQASCCLGLSPTESSGALLELTSQLAGGPGNHQLGKTLRMTADLLWPEAYSGARVEKVEMGQLSLSKTIEGAATEKGVSLLSVDLFRVIQPCMLDKDMGFVESSW